MDKKTIEIINGYEVKYNNYWLKWGVSHKDIGANIAWFSEFEDAAEYCLKG